MKASILTVFVLVLVLANAARAQTNGTFLLTSTTVVSPTSPSTTIEVWATWVDQGPQYVFRGADYDLSAADGIFSNPANILNGPGSSTGAIFGNVITGAGNGQLHLPPVSLASTDNPILLASYDWTTSDFTPRTVRLDTSGTANFVVARFSDGAVVSLFPNNFTPGSGVITVIPAPAVWFALPLFAARRRRR